MDKTSTVDRAKEAVGIKVAGHHEERASVHKSIKPFDFEYERKPNERKKKKSNTKETLSTFPPVCQQHLSLSLFTPAPLILLSHWA